MNPKAKFLFSVIIPTCHRNDLLARCLKTLAPGAQTLSVEWYEVIVTDDGSETTAEQMIRGQFPWVKWVPGPRKGPAANRNNGAKYAKGECLIFTDDDCLPDSNWLRAYMAAIQAHPEYFVFEGRTYANRPKQSLAEYAPINEAGGCLWSCNFAIRKEIFKIINGFDERFPYNAMEDVDLKIRLHKQGFQYRFVTNASVCHPWKSRYGWEELRRYQESTFIYLSIHPEEKKNINSRYYLEMALRTFVRSTIPGIIKFKGKGMRQAFLEQFHFIYMACHLWV
jgi:GT2 family glycosyltransferase